MTSVAFVSAIYGDYDTPTAPVDQTVPVEWVLVTDNPLLQAPGWRVVCEPRAHMHPRLAAKIPKCMPWLYSDANVLIWVDGSAQVINPETAERIAETLDARRGHPRVAMFRHPDRKSILDEADISAQMVKYQGQPVKAQVDSYWGRERLRHDLWATGLIGWPTTTAQAVGGAWFLEQARWTYQDQLSWPLVAYAVDIIDLCEQHGPLWDNDLVRFAGHNRET